MIFSSAIRYRTRFLHDENVKLFLRAVADSSERRCCVLPANKALWRAQLGHDLEKRSQDDHEWDEPSPFAAHRMKPLRDQAHEGRVNPRGIPCLYAANIKETAVAEIRPWLGALVSVAQLRIVRDLRLVDCSEGHDSKFDIYFEEPAPDEREKNVWRAIGRAFSNPANPDPAIAEYAPTQVLSEQFRQQGYDGVAYQSKLGTGFNVALFDLDLVEVVDVRLYPVKAVQYEIGDLENSYVVKHRKGTA